MRNEPCHWSQYGVLILLLIMPLFIAHCGGKPLGEATATSSPSPSPSSSASGSVVTTLASGLRSPSSIALYGDYVYWADCYGNAIYRVPKAGGSVETMVSKGLSYPYVIDIYNNHIYIGEADPTQPTARVNSIKRIAVTGGDSPVTLYSSQFMVGGMSIDSSHVYWTEHVLTSGTTVGGVKQGSCDGSTSVVTLGTSLSRPSAIEAYNNIVYYTEEGTSSDGIVSSGNGNVRRVSAGGGNTVLLASDLYEPTSLSVATSKVYFCEAGSRTGSTSRGAIKSTLLDAYGATSLITTANRITCVYYDSSNNSIYYSESDSTYDKAGYLKKVSTTGTRTTLESGLCAPGDLLTVNVYVYWIQANWSGGSGAILRRVK